jgi:hypothetical protein
MDEIGMISSTIVVKIAVNESGIKIGTGTGTGIKIGIGIKEGIGIGIGVFLLRVGHLLRPRPLLVGRDRGKDLQCRISRDVMRPCMRDEMKMHVVVVEEGVGIGVERGIEDMNVVAAKKFKLLKNIQTHFFLSVDFFRRLQFGLGPPVCSIYCCSVLS